MFWAFTQQNHYIDNNNNQNSDKMKIDEEY